MLKGYTVPEGLTAISVEDQENMVVEVRPYCAQGELSRPHIYGKDMWVHCTPDGELLLSKSPQGSDWTELAYRHAGGRGSHCEVILPAEEAELDWIGMEKCTNVALRLSRISLRELSIDRMATDSGRAVPQMVTLEDVDVDYFGGHIESGSFKSDGLVVARRGLLVAHDAMTVSLTRTHGLEVRMAQDECPDESCAEEALNFGTKP